MAGPEHNHSRGQMVTQDQVVELSVIGYAGCTIQLSGTWTGTVTFEGSENGTDYQSMAVLVLSEASAVVTTATANGIWRAAVAGLSRVRARLSTGGTGTVMVGFRATVGGVGPMAVGSGGAGSAVTIADAADVALGATTDAKTLGDTNGTAISKLRGLSTILNDAWNSVTHRLLAAVEGFVAHDGADSGNPVKVGGRARSSFMTAVSSDDRTDAMYDLVGRQVMAPYANPENLVNGCISSAMTGTTSTSLVAAPGAGLYNHITHLVVSNSHATIGTDVELQDGNGGTTFYVIPAAAVYGGATLSFPAPLRQPTANTAVYAKNTVTGASTRVSASGYKGN